MVRFLGHLFNDVALRARMDALSTGNLGLEALAWRMGEKPVTLGYLLLESPNRPLLDDIKGLDLT